MGERIVNVRFEKLYTRVVLADCGVKEGREEV
jgi:hypothetical protein